MKSLFTDRFSRNMEELWFVSIAHPYYKPELSWTATTTFDNLSADTLAKLGGHRVPIERIQANNQSEAIGRFKILHPEFQKYFKELDSQDVEVSL